MAYGWLEQIWDGVFPPRCTLCQDAGWRRMAICRPCMEELPRLAKRCPRCAAAVETPDGMPCGACIRRPPAFDKVVAPFRYRPPLDHFIVELKFHERLSMAALLAALFDMEAQADPPGALIPVPLHERRWRMRGFNQALELARQLAARRVLKLLGHSLVRLRETAPQSELPASTRRRNLRRAFALRGAAQLPAHVALVDDVMTTGATAHECAATLKSHGVERVDVWVMARA